MSFKIKFLPDNKEVIVNKDTDLLTAALNAGVGIYNSCGGKGICGKCKVKIISGETDKCTLHLSEDEIKNNYVLACKTFCKTDAEVFVPEESRIGKADILIRGKKIFEPIDIKLAKSEKDITKSKDLGIAIDIGTTTLVVYLINPNYGILSAKAMYNPQIAFGEDVITRMIFAENKEGNEQLHNSVVNGINELIEECIKEINIPANNIKTVMVAANTTMTHTLFGINPSYIRKIPYIPKMDFLPLSDATKLGININDNAVVKAIPSVSAYVGGDIVSGVIACNINHTSKPTLFIDLGTNGEVVFGNNEFLVCCSTSAGPCFEGGGIKWGMRAQAGAIESFKFENDKISYKTIGNQKAIGICGAGIISVISELFLKRVIDKSGEFVVGSSKHIKKGEHGSEFFITDKISMTSEDVKNVINSKGAVFSGCEVIIKKLGFEFSQIEQVKIAGGLGNALDIEKAIILGLLPDLPIERYEFVGNASITGAKECLMSEKELEEAKQVARMMTYIDLSTEHDFMNNYTASLFLPHTDLNLFPTVKNILEV
ncbi:MAG TPA: hypothetical protein DCP53_03630 [Elusimicrobia bacterium]|nr:hypothetical protein [Elusimicrobiota bacterium]